MENITFQINDELQDRAIEEYLNILEERRSEQLKKELRLAYVILSILFWVFFAFAAFMQMLSGGFKEGLWLFVVSTVIILVIVGISVLIVKYMYARTARKEMEKLKVELNETTYRIEDGNLYRDIIGDKRRTRKMPLSKISCLEKEGNIIYFDYKSQSVEITDCFEPSLYDTLAELVD
jgi:uncharacterized membrane protein YhdT